MAENTEPVISEFKPPKNIFHIHLPTMPKAVVRIGMLVVVVIVVFGGWYWYNRPLSGVCSDSLIDQAASSLNYANLSELQPIVANMQTLHNYQRDPNCMYIVTTYYVNQDNITKAQSSLAQFNKEYKGKINSRLEEYSSVSQLRESVMLEAKDQQESESKSAALSPPPITSSIKGK